MNGVMFCNHGLEASDRKMSVLSKLTYVFNETLISIPANILWTVTSLFCNSYVKAEVLE
jgi:hypothetical protein